MKFLLRFIAFLALLTFSSQQIVLANPAFGTPFSGTILPLKDNSKGNLPSATTASLPSAATASPQFSAYTLKTIAVAYQVSLEGLKLTWDELVKLTGAGVPVLVNIEERHFAVVTSVANGLVTFKENGYTRVKSETEFKARWFSSLGSSSNQGAALVETGYNTNLLTAGVDHTLTAKELLKVKGAGWFKKLFKKIAKFFQKVIDAIVKVIQKVMAAITKAFVAVFGKTIGGALAGIVNSIINILTFPVHVAYYASHGDWKGLMKYMGQTLLQVAMIAIQFIPVVGQMLGALFQMLGTFLQFIGQALVQLGSLAGRFLGPVLGGVLKGALHFAGGFLEGLGGSLVQYGANLAKNSKNIFQNLKEQGFKYVTDSLKKGLGNLINQLNPVTYYQNLTQSVTQSLKQLGFKNSLSKLLDWSKEQFVSNIIQKKIDQSLEKSKMNSFLKSVISTVASAGVQALSSAVIGGVAGGIEAVTKNIGSLASIGQGISSGVSSLINGIANGAKMLYQGGKAIVSAVGQGLQTLGRGIGNALNATKSFFSSIGEKIFGPRGPPVNAPTYDGKTLRGSFGNGQITLGDGVAIASDGSVQVLNKQGQFLSYQVKKTSDGKYDFTELDEGDQIYIKTDPQTKEISFIQRIQNLVTNAGTQIGGALLELGHKASEFLTQAKQTFARFQEAIVGPIRRQFFPEAEIDRLVKSGKYPEAINFASKRFGYLPGIYDPGNPAFKRPNLVAFANPSGQIVYGERAFFDRVYDPKAGWVQKYVPTRLQSVGLHESIHVVEQFNKNRVIFDTSGGIANRNLLEMEAAQEAILNASRMRVSKAVNQGMVDYYDDNVTEYNLTHPNKEPLWHQRPRGYRVNVLKR